MCTELKSAKYQTRKAPAFHAGDCKGATKTGKDGAYVSKADKRGVYKWVKTGKFYDVHDNGGRPFRVYVNGPAVSIYKGTFEEDDTYTYDQMLRTARVKKTYLGTDGAFVGNSVLLHLSGNKYMYIGSQIYEFQMEDAVDSYFSLVGNSDVPYPVLLGTTNVYFMLDRTYVPRSSFPPGLKAKDWKQAYDLYYEGIDKKKGLSTQAKKIKGLRFIRPKTRKS